MKKKLLSIIFSFTIVSTLTGCVTVESKPTNQTNVANNTSTSETNTEATSESTETTTEAPKDSGSLGDFEITIKDATFTKDFEGNNAIVINYDFTNNSKEATSPFLTVIGKAFQDGIELESAVIMDDKVYDLSIDQKEIKSGVTLENCQIAFVLSSESPVEFEISELISFNDKKLVKTFEIPKN